MWIRLNRLAEKVEYVETDPDSVNLMRDDVAVKPKNPQKFLKQAPDREGNFIKVKSILE